MNVERNVEQDVDTVIQTRCTDTVIRKRMFLQLLLDFACCGSVMVRYMKGLVLGYLPSIWRHGLANPFLPLPFWGYNLQTGSRQLPRRPSWEI
jgi:hypothetical protein